MRAIYFTHKPLPSFPIKLLPPPLPPTLTHIIFFRINSISIFSIKFYFQNHVKGIVESFTSDACLPAFASPYRADSFLLHKSTISAKKLQREELKAINKLCNTSITYRIFIFDCQSENLSKLNYTPRFLKFIARLTSEGGNWNSQ